MTTEKNFLRESPLWSMTAITLPHLCCGVVASTWSKGYYHTKYYHNNMESVLALMRLESDEAYGKAKLFSIHRKEWLCQWWRDKTDEHGIDSALVSLADHIFDRFNYAMNRQVTQAQVILIQISALVIAIKANYGMNVRVATDIATEACAEFNVLPHELASMETEIRHTLNGHVNAPTVHVFLNAYTPLMTNSSNYILDIARFQIDLATLIPLIMVNYNPSIIAFAALMRADDVVYRAMMRPDISNDEVDNDDDDDNWLTRGDYDGLMDDLGLDQAVVLDAVFALENEIPNSRISLYMNWVDLRGVPPGPVQPGPNAMIREESPTTVPASPISVMR